MLNSCKRFRARVASALEFWPLPTIKTQPSSPRMDTYEDQSVRSWFRSLDPEIRNQLRTLHKLNRRGNLICIYLALVWAATAFIMHQFPYWPVRIMGYGVIGLVLHGYGNFMHEGIHGNLFRKTSLDRWAGFLGGLPTFVSATAYHVAHMLHQPLQSNRTGSGRTG